MSNHESGSRFDAARAFVYLRGARSMAATRDPRACGHRELLVDHRARVVQCARCLQLLDPLRVIENMHDGARAA